MGAGEEMEMMWPKFVKLIPWNILPSEQLTV
jgi:hypothetical protein